MYVGIDIGGTNIRVATSETPWGAPIINRRDFLDGPNYYQNHDEIVRSIRSLTNDVTAIGIAMPGLLSNDMTTITHSLMVTQWINKPITRALAEEFHCPVVMQRDQHCASLAEALVAAPQIDFCRIGWGSGIGAAWVTYAGGAITMTHMTPEIHAAFIRPWQEKCAGYWLKASHPISPAEFTDLEWSSILTDFAYYLSRFLQVYPAKQVVFGGGMAVKQWERLKAMLLQTTFVETKFRLSHYKEDDGLIGALALLRNITT